MKKPLSHHDLLKTAFFPVEQRPLFLEVEGMLESFRKLPRHLAVLDVESQTVFAVVTDDYDLVTNEKAFGMGAEVMARVFRVLEADDLECMNVIMPKTRSFCHIDLVKKATEFQPFPEDRWTAFLRITNSYNRTRLLKFELGFCRGICKNGVIFGSKSVEYSYVHTKGSSGKTERFKDNIGDIRKLEEQFTRDLLHLKRYHVPDQFMLGLACKVFNFRVESEPNPKASQSWIGLRDHLDRLTDSYFREMGPHGYAALNVLTDFASRPQGGIAPENQIHPYQTKVGDWIGEFISQIEHRDFSFEAYLKDVQATVACLRGLTVPRTKVGLFDD